MDEVNPFAASRWQPNRKKDRNAVQRVPESPKVLNIVLPCWKGDQDQAERLLKWIGELGVVQAPFYLVCGADCKVQLLLDLARKCFSKVTYIQDREAIESNWHEKGDHPKSAAGPNSLFRQIAWYFYSNNLGPWFFMEPDAIPCKKEWYWMIEREYQLGGKPFMGFHVNPVNHPGVPQHMSGVAVYPANTPVLAPKASNAGEVAFDIAGTEETCRDDVTHWTRIIEHKYRPPAFSTQDDFESRVPETLAIYHSDKTGSILPFLSRRLGITGTIEIESSKTRMDFRDAGMADSFLKDTIESMSKVHGWDKPTCDIFIKTREHDYPWLEWCVKSIEKFTSGFRNRIIQTDNEGPNCSLPIERNRKHEDLIGRPPKEPGYLWQQVCKLTSDTHTDADYILFQDSDTIFTRPVTPSDFIRDGKPIWLYTSLDKARPDQHHWIGVMEKFLGKRPEHEFMRRHPFCVKAEMLKDFRTFCQYRHGKTIEEYIMGEADPQNGLALKFSEWNCLGFFLWEYHRDRVAWVLDHEAGPACTYQGFSHGGEARKQEDIAKFREILEDTPAASIAVQGVGKAEEVCVPPPLTLKGAIDFLVEEASKGQYQKIQVLKMIEKAGLKKGGHLKKVTPKPASERKGLNDTLLLAIHSYPGANDTFQRHFENYKLIGADRIVGIGTTDGKCVFPCESVNIGENKYIQGDHLVRRLMDTVAWCLEQPEDRFCIMEYDVLPLRRPPRHRGICAVKTGDQLPRSKATRFFHMPVWFDRPSGEKMLEVMKQLAPQCTELPDNSPDVFLGYIFDVMKVTPEEPYTMFTRNSWDQPGDLQAAVDAALNNTHILHGCKKEHEYHTIMNALRGQVSEKAA